MSENAELTSLRNERQRHRNNLVTMSAQLDVVAGICDELAAKIEDCNIRIACYHVLHPKPMSLELIDEEVGADVADSGAGSTENNNVLHILFSKNNTVEPIPPTAA